PAPDAKAVITAMSEAAKAATSVSYKAEFHGEGDIANKVPKVSGQVQIVRGATPRESKINIDGTIQKRSRKESYRVAANGKTIVRLIADKKEVTHGELPEA